MVIIHLEKNKIKNKGKKAIKRKKIKKLYKTTDFKALMFTENLVVLLLSQ